MFYFSSREKARQYATKAGRKVLDMKNSPSVNGSRWAVSTKKG